jgi:DNA-directed RNA polymerase subunit RPC12/RpoP
MADVKEKLVELIAEAKRQWEGGTNNLDARIADHLIANGVTVQEWGHWVSYQSDEPYGCNDEKEWYKCSKCGKDANGRCYEDEWYSAPILSKRCPHCGTKMMPQPPKGE